MFHQVSQLGQQQIWMDGLFLVATLIGVAMLFGRRLPSAEGATKASRFGRLEWLLFHVAAVTILLFWVRYAPWVPVS